jgi:Alr-MurF fusion protein
MTITQIAQHLGAEILQLAHPDQPVRALALDTRQIPLPDALFFAIKGQRHNGHHYLRDAYEVGIRQMIVSERIDIQGFEEANILLVNDTLQALQAVAAAHRAQFDIPVVGITGSNAKTIVKEWLYQLLAPSRRIARSPKSFNSQVGVPLSVWGIGPEHELAIIEAGISTTGEMERLVAVIRPTVGIFTNIGTAHSDGFESDAQKVAEKMLLFKGAQHLVYCADHPLIAAEVSKSIAHETELWSWSSKGNPARFDVFLTNLGQQTYLRTAAEGHSIEAVIPFVDDASIENALHCLFAGLALGADVVDLVNGLSALHPIEMRLELKAGIEGSTLVNDFYNNDLSSLQILLQFAQQQSKGKRSTLVLSDILQSGLHPDDLYKKVAVFLTKIHRFVGIGQEIEHIAAHLPKNTETHFYPDTDAFLADIHRFSWRDDLIMLKGARPFTFEHIARRLEQKAHQTRLEINLGALIHNLHVYNSLLAPGVKTMVMVKAAAYGSGGAEVARLLEFHKVAYLGVAYADEGIELRQGGVNLPIMVLNPDTAGFDVFFRYELEPEIFSMDILRELVAYAGTERKMRIHIKLDTGMHRLGFEPNDMDELGQTLRLHPNLRVATVFSHLSASDNAAHDGFSHQQAERFVDMYEVLATALGYRPLRHIVNTGGIVRFPQYHFDMVRLGIGLYGIDGSGLQERLQVVNELKTTISQVKKIPAGDTVGYNRNSGPLQHTTTTATISIGYADGLLRAAGGGRYKMLINNVLVPTIGNVCMDMTMLDVSEIPDVKAGDEVVVFGHKPSVELLAACFGTIPYEIFTNISDRVKRVYVQD